MPDLPPTSISEYFGDLTDPRREHLREHQLIDIMSITLCAVICSADDWVQVATFGRAREACLRTFLALPGGIPSHDTFGRVFVRLDPEELRRCFLNWVADVGGAPGEQVVAVDGKTVRGSHDRRRGTDVVYALNPKAGDRYRERTRVTGGKTNPVDAELRERILVTDRDLHQPLRPSSSMVEEIRVLARQDERASRDQRRLLNHLRHDLLAVFPAALDAFPDLTAVSALAFLSK